MTDFLQCQNHVQAGKLFDNIYKNAPKYSHECVMNNIQCNLQNHIIKT